MHACSAFFFFFFFFSYKVSNKTLNLLKDSKFTLIAIEFVSVHLYDMPFIYSEETIIISFQHSVMRRSV